MRPTSLSITKQQKYNETITFLREAFLAWSSRSRLNLVPEDKIQELFYEVRLYPTRQQVSDMLQTAKLFARRGGCGFDGSSSSRFCLGLTFGEFCVLAADFRKFRTSLQSHCFQNGRSKTPPPRLGSPKCKRKEQESVKYETTLSPGNGEDGTLSNNGPEVFLGGSCNPTTWRADVAIPALHNLGISFYNPQVSSWTPDLIELEHRAKEKARILFFVMDSETRATAAAIEVAHIAGQNLKHLVLVLHPYRLGQRILNEPISNEEFLDLTRNQKLLHQLVSRRGLLVLDNIPTALQRVKGILSGEIERDPPDNVASRLISVRRSFDRIAGKSEFGLTLTQCQNALTWLGFPPSLTTVDTLKQVLHVLKDIQQDGENNIERAYINFEEYCLVTSYLSVLQQEIIESSCVSPIKGINLPPPPIFLSNSPECIHNQSVKSPTVERPVSMQPSIFRSHTEQACHKSFSSSDCSEGSNRDSGTSSPQPNELKLLHLSSGFVDNNSTSSVTSKVSINVEDESDSNDSVFSAGSSASSDEVTLFNDDFGRVEVRDIYLGGSCMLRTRWRQDFAIPYLESKGISYYQPTLHESLCKTHFDIENETKVASNTSSASSSSTVTPTSQRSSSPSSSQTVIHHQQQSQPQQQQQTTQPPQCDTNVKDQIRDKTKRNELVNGSSKMNKTNKLNGNNDSTESSASSNNEDISDLLNCSSLFTQNEVLMYNPAILDSSRVLLFVITNETRSLAPMTLAAHCIGLGYNVVLCVQMLPENCTIGHDQLTVSAVKDYNRGRSYLIDLAKRQGIPCFNEIKAAVLCAIDKVKVCKSRNSV